MKTMNTSYLNLLKKITTSYKNLRLMLLKRLNKLYRETLIGKIINTEIIKMMKIRKIILIEWNKIFPNRHLKTRKLFSISNKVWYLKPLKKRKFLSLLITLLWNLLPPLKIPKTISWKEWKKSLKCFLQITRIR